MADRRVRIGVWAPSDDPAGWADGGVVRFLGPLIEGGAARGAVSFHVCVPGAPANPLRMLRLLAAREGVDWTLTSRDGTLHVSPVDTDPAHRGHDGAGHARPTRRNPAQLRWLLLGLMLVAIPLQVLHAAVRPLWRVLWQNGLSAMPVLLHTTRMAWRDPVYAASVIATMLAQQRWAPLRRLGMVLRAWESEVCDDWPELPSPPLPALPTTDGWLVIGADTVGGLHLPGRRIALIADRTPLDCPLSWGAGERASAGRLKTWTRRAAATLSGVDGVITLSRHVAERHVVGRFGVARAHVATLRTAPPDLRPLLPACPPDRVLTPASRRASADMLRRHAADRCWTYLADFPLEDASYVFAPILDGPLDNGALVVEAVRLLLRREYVDIKLLTTAPRQHGASGSGLWRAVDDGEMRFEVLSVPDLPRELLAAVYHCAAVTVHPAFVEAGVGSLPVAESVSVGTPGLMALGPHSLELVEEEPSLRPYLFDPYDPEALATLVRRVVADRAHALAVQQAAWARWARRSWSDVADECAALVTGKASSAAVPIGRVSGSRSQGQTAD